jgi:hypothetical protein
MARTVGSSSNIRISAAFWRIQARTAEDPSPAVTVSKGSIAGGRCEVCKMVPDPNLERDGKTSVGARSPFARTTSATRRMGGCPGGTIAQRCEDAKAFGPLVVA